MEHKYQLTIDLSNYGYKAEDDKFVITSPTGNKITIYFGRVISYRMTPDELELVRRIACRGQYDNLKGTTYNEKMRNQKTIPFMATISEMNTLLKLSKIFK